MVSLYAAVCARPAPHQPPHLRGPPPAAALAIARPPIPLPTHAPTQPPARQPHPTRPSHLDLPLRLAPARGRHKIPNFVGTAPSSVFCFRRARVSSLPRGTIRLTKPPLHPLFPRRIGGGEGSLSCVREQAMPLVPPPPALTQPTAPSEQRASLCALHFVLPLAAPLPSPI